MPNSPAPGPLFAMQTNSSLVARLLSFLGEGEGQEEGEGQGSRGSSQRSPALSFVRMPSWFREKKHDDRRKVHRDFWMI